MARVLVFLAACLTVNAAPPSPQYFPPAPAQLQQINPLDYYLDNPEEGRFYHEQQKTVNNPSQNGRLETLEPDSEVELIPGAQQPQQPPQQNPVAPNIPGLIPGQRVFIVHMPVPGYRPGTVGGYQPVYIVAAAPQGNAYPGNGYQNGVLLDPSGQGVVAPVLGYPRPGLSLQGANPLLYNGAPLLNRSPYDLVYQQDPLAYQPTQNGQLVGALVPQSPVAVANPNNNLADPANTGPKSGQVRIESKDNAEEERRNARPVPPHATRNKA